MIHQHIELDVEENPLTKEMQDLARRLVEASHAMIVQLAPSNAVVCGEKGEELALSAAMQILMGASSGRESSSNQTIVTGLAAALGAFLSMTGLEEDVRPIALDQVREIALRSARGFDASSPDNFATVGNA